MAGANAPAPASPGYARAARHPAACIAPAHGQRRAGDGVIDAPPYRAWGARVAVARVETAAELPKYVVWVVQVRVVGVKISWGQISFRKMHAYGWF